MLNSSLVNKVHMQNIYVLFTSLVCDAHITFNLVAKKFRSDKEKQDKWDFF